MSESRTAWGWGLASVDEAGNTLDVWYPKLTVGEAPAEGSRPNHNFDMMAHMEADARGVRRLPVFTVSQLDEPIADAADAYLRLHLMSMRLAKPNTLNLDGIFGKLATVVWTNYGPFATETYAVRKMDVEAERLRTTPGMPHAGVTVISMDMFPRMLDYVIPSGVRVADGGRARLGAYLSEGTTVMHAGFVNFNAGTLGTSMVEGRISQGVVVGNGSDIGGGASIMGTLSGGGKHRVSIGEHSPLAGGPVRGGGRPVPDGRHPDHRGGHGQAGRRRTAGRGQGRRAERQGQHPVHPQLADRRHRGPVPQDRHRAEQRAAPAQLSAIASTPALSIMREGPFCAARTTT